MIGQTRREVARAVMNDPFYRVGGDHPSRSKEVDHERFHKVRIPPRAAWELKTCVPIPTW